MQENKRRTQLKVNHLQFKISVLFEKFTSRVQMLPSKKIHRRNLRNKQELRHTRLRVRSLEKKRENTEWNNPVTVFNDEYEATVNNNIMFH